jgi:hypothetical protein
MIQRYAQVIHEYRDHIQYVEGKLVSGIIQQGRTEETNGLLFTRCDELESDHVREMDELQADHERRESEHAREIEKLQAEIGRKKQASQGKPASKHGEKQQHKKHTPPSSKRGKKDDKRSGKKERQRD